MLPLAHYTVSHVKANLCFLKTNCNHVLPFPEVLLRFLHKNPNSSIQHVRPRIVCPLPIPPASSLPAPHASPRAQIHCSCACSVLGPTPLQPQGLCTSCVLLSHLSPTWLPHGTLLRFLHTSLQSRSHGSFMQFITAIYTPQFSW